MAPESCRTAQNSSTDVNQRIAEARNHQMHVIYDNNNSRVTTKKDETTHLTQRRIREEKFQFRTQYSERDLLKNMLILSVACVFVLSAFAAIQNLQSSLYGSSYLGVYTMCVLYMVTACSCLFGPALVRKIYPNWTIILSFVMFAIFVSTHFYPTSYTLFPSCILLGLFFGPFLSAQSTFLVLLASKYSSSDNKVQDKDIQRFLRLFYFMYNSNQIWGNLFTSVVMTVGTVETKIKHVYGDVSTNQAQQVTTSDIKMALCQENMNYYSVLVANSTLSNLRSLSVYHNLSSNVSLVLISGYLTLTLLGVVIVTSLLDKIEMFVSQDPMERSHVLVTATKISSLLLSHKQSKLTYILPMVFFIGMEQGFMYSDFSKEYVTCSLGIHHVGYTMVCFGITSAFGTVSLHHFSKHFTRLFALAAGLVFHSGLLFVLWIWTPNSEDVALFYVITTGWGLCSSIWETLSLTLISKFYQDEWESSFTAYYIIHSLGLAASFGMTGLLNDRIKVYILTGLLVIAFVPYTSVEVQLYNRNSLSERTNVV